ncbi:hypothetical protein E8E12_003956 [Didymella heteroderae]|uniref:ATPase n=1 Tax=Didymella heteroderae TaxID=1769908 RepID=A0A9P4WQU9_9PLEO|nr:hypothetical protein E8E12_003956 [Didymella heteroderae]
MSLVSALQHAPVFFTIYATFALCFWFAVELYLDLKFANVETLVVVLMSIMTMLAHISAISVPLASFAHAITAANVFFTIIDAPKPTSTGVGGDIVDTAADIVIQNVNFAYPTRHDVKVLDGLSLCIRAGQKTAIVGPSGSGKSTTVALIQRWYELGEADPIASYLRNGLIKIGDTELKNIDLLWWRSQIGIVQQEPFLFDDTVFKNVAFGLTGTKWESSSRKLKERLVIQACKEAYAHDFICLLPEGYHTPMGDRGLHFSGGQRQRIAIARAIVRQPKILIFDEATSALDVTSERIVQAALDRVAKSRTTIIIAHRLATISDADCIIVMKKGRVIQQGTHDDLVKVKDGAYWSLVRSQQLAASSTKSKDRNRYGGDLEHKSRRQGSVVEKESYETLVESETTVAEAAESVSSAIQTAPHTPNPWKSFRLLVSEQRRNWGRYLVMIIAAMAAAASSPLQAYLFGRLISSFAYWSEALRISASFLCLMLLVVAVGVGLSYFTLGWVSNEVSIYTVSLYRKEYFTNMISKPLSYFDDVNSSAGVLSARLAADPVQLQQLLGMNMAMVLISIFGLIGCVIIAEIFHWKFALVVIAPSLPIILAAIVGSSGSGKTTIISLLERFYEPTTGQITYNGDLIQSMSLTELRGHMSLVAQEPFLLHGTIRENITLGVADNNLDDALLHQACRDAEIHDFIASLPNGYDTNIGSAGVMLSGGQKQRISIARALIRDPDLLLLDEATSSLDSETETEIQKTEGVKEVGPDTIYRIGSVSKIFTVLAFLAEVGDTHWNTPITEFIPELAQFSARALTQPIDDVRRTDWEDITIGALVAQVSGVGRDYGVLGELTQTENITVNWQSSFPTLRGATVPPCGGWPLCTRNEFFAGIEMMVPSYLPWQTAAYSNIGYQLLSYALESMTGKKFVEILNTRVIEPLGLRHTYYENAPPSLGVIPTTTKDDYWWVNLGDANPGGNMYSSANDISTLGHAILSSRLIKPSLTRRWLNPITFTSDFAAAVGAPWGVRRIQLDPFHQPYRSLSVYTKAGTFRKYTAFLTLLKEYNLGFTIMMVGESSLNNFMVADMLGASLIPAYDEAARDEANEIYSGIYVSHGSGAMPNSSLVITTDPNKPGLGILSWISNGTDMIETAVQLQKGSNTTAARAEARLYYTQLETQAKNGEKRQSWKAVFEDTGLPSAPGPMLFSTGCGAWVGLTGVTYGSLPLDEFVFDFDSNGNVRSVTNLALRTTLYKVDLHQSTDLLPALCNNVCPYLVKQT